MKRTSVDALTARLLGLAMPLARESLHQAQLARLRETVEWAKTHSHFYQKHLSAFAPGNLHDRADLGLLPFLTAADLSAAPFDLLCVSQSRISRIITLETSGSTGPPKRIFFTPKDLSATLDFFYEGMLNLISERDRVLVLLPASQPDGVGNLLLRALSGQGVHCSAVWPPPPAEILAKDVEENLQTCVVGLPLHLLALAESLPRDSCVKSMLLCSDYAPAVVRKRIEAACGCTTFLHYGATETGLGGGVECGMHRGCHLREADLLVEIVASDGSEPLADGELGEVVISTLARRGMPLIRYRTGDLARLDRRTCRCGGSTARLCDIRGRNKGCMLAGAHVLFSQDLDDALFRLEGLLDFRAIIDPDQPACLHIEYRTGREYPAEAEIREALLAVPAVREAVAGGGLVIEEMRQVTAFSADHTIKRSILDRRP